MLKRRSKPQMAAAPAPSPPIDPPFTEEEIKQLRQFMAGIDPQALSAGIEATEATLETETVIVSRKDWHMYLLGAENMRRAAYESMYAHQQPRD